MGKANQRRPRYQKVQYKLLRPGQPFKISQSHVTWWVKMDDSRALSLRRDLSTPMQPSDQVWVDFGAGVVDLLA